MAFAVHSTKTSLLGSSTIFVYDSCLGTAGSHWIWECKLNSGKVLLLPSRQCVWWQIWQSQTLSNLKARNHQLISSWVTYSNQFKLTFFHMTRQSEHLAKQKVDWDQPMPICKAFTCFHCFPFQRYAFCNQGVYFSVGDVFTHKFKLFMCEKSLAAASGTAFADCHHLCLLPSLSNVRHAEKDLPWLYWKIWKVRKLLSRPGE